jgi:hypothetical protein
MPSKLKLTLTCGDYDIVRSLKETKQDGFEIEMRTAISRLRASRDRVSQEDRNIPQTP